jgi:hypothetical protein
MASSIRGGVLLVGSLLLLSRSAGAGDAHPYYWGSVGNYVQLIQPRTMCDARVPPGAAWDAYTGYGWDRDRDRDGDTLGNGERSHFADGGHGSRGSEGSPSRFADDGHHLRDSGRSRRTHAGRDRVRAEDPSPRYYNRRYTASGDASGDASGRDARVNQDPIFESAVREVIRQQQRDADSLPLPLPLPTLAGLRVGMKVAWPAKQPEMTDATPTAEAPLFFRKNDGEGRVTVRLSASVEITRADDASDGSVAFLLAGVAVQKEATTRYLNTFFFRTPMAGTQLVPSSEGARRDVWLLEGAVVNHRIVQKRDWPPRLVIDVTYPTESASSEGSGSDSEESAGSGSSGPSADDAEAVDDDDAFAVALETWEQRRERAQR